MMLAAVRRLGVIDRHQAITYRVDGVGRVAVLAGSRGRKLNEAPALGPVHVDRALRRPDPVVLPHVGRFLVRFSLDEMVPLDPGEVHSPLVARLWRRGPVGELGKDAPWNRELDCPRGVSIGW